MSHSRARRGYRQSRDRSVRVFPNRSHERRYDAVAQILTLAGLEQARREAEAHAEIAHDLEQRPPLADGGDRV